eukprot:g61976.t1
MYYGSSNPGRIDKGLNDRSAKGCPPDVKLCDHLDQCQQFAAACPSQDFTRHAGFIRRRKVAVDAGGAIPKHRSPVVSIPQAECGAFWGRSARHPAATNSYISLVSLLKRKRRIDSVFCLPRRLTARGRLCCHVLHMLGHLIFNDSIS